MKTKIILGLTDFIKDVKLEHKFLLGRGGSADLNIQMRARPIRHRMLGFVLKCPIFEQFCP